MASSYQIGPRMWLQELAALAGALRAEAVPEWITAYLGRPTDAEERRKAEIVPKARAHSRTGTGRAGSHVDIDLPAVPTYSCG